MDQNVYAFEVLSMDMSNNTISIFDYTTLTSRLEHAETKTLELKAKVSEACNLLRFCLKWEDTGGIDYKQVYNFIKENNGWAEKCH
jgi:hypothetical protein